MSNLLKALKQIEDNKNNFSKTVKENQPPKNFGKRLPHMQEYCDESQEKKDKFIEVVKTTLCKETNKPIIKKGVIVYARLVNTVKLLGSLAKENGIEYKCITGATSIKKRGETEDWFKDNPRNKIVFISDAGGASLNLNATNELILYSIPTSYRKAVQVLGRVCRDFGEFDKFNIHLIMVEGAIDEYNKELLSSKSTIENDLLNADTIAVGDNKQYTKEIFTQVRADLLWRKNKLKNVKNIIKNKT